MLRKRSNEALAKCELEQPSNEILLEVATPKHKKL